MSKLYKEPLVHFIIGALCIFIYFWAIGESRDTLSYEININSSDIDRITADAVRSSNRLPTHDEVTALVDKAIKDEIYYREALRLGLDKDDAIVERRLANKMRSLNNSDIAEPSDKQLQQWIDKYPQKYTDSNIYDFRQIYIGRNSSRDMQKKWLNQLQDNSLNPNIIKAPLSIKEEQKSLSDDAIKKKFGSQFIKSLRSLKAKQWQGPIESGFGMHFIFIHQKKAGQAPILDTIRQKVSNDWRAAESKRQEEKVFKELSQQYVINRADTK